MRPVRGVAQAVVAWSYTDNLQSVWLWLVGLAAIFYFLPKLRGRDLHSRYLALLVFWTVLLFGSWGGIPPTAPVPAWMPVLSSVATVLTAIPLLAIGLSAWRTLWPAGKRLGGAGETSRGVGGRSCGESQGP